MGCDLRRILIDGWRSPENNKRWVAISESPPHNQSFPLQPVITPPHPSFRAKREICFFDIQSRNDTVICARRLSFSAASLHSCLTNGKSCSYTESDRAGHESVYWGIIPQFILTPSAVIDINPPGLRLYNMEVVNMRRLTIIILCLIVATAVAVGASVKQPDRDPKESRSYTPPSASTQAPSTPRASGPSYSPQSPSPGGYSTPTRYSPNPTPTPLPDKSRSTYTRIDTTPSVPPAPRNDSITRSDSYRPGTSTYQRPTTPTPDRSEPDQAATQPGGASTHYSSGYSRESKIRDHGPGNLSGDPKPRSSTYYQRPTTKPPSSSCTPDRPENRPATSDDRLTRKSDQPRPGDQRGSDNISGDPKPHSSTYYYQRPTTRPSSSNYTPGKPENRTDKPAPKDDRIIQRPDQSRPSDDRGSDSSGYRPHKPATSVPSNRLTDDRNRRPNLGYRPTLPKTTKYVIGYRPAAPYVPSTYRPPTYRMGFYYYPASYYDRPCYYAYWAPVYAPGFSYRSVYYSFGLFPYLRVTRISTLSYTTISYVTAPIYVDNVYYRETRYAYLDETLSDIRSGWIAGRYDLVDRHVRSDRMISVLLDGQYDYSVSGEDYLSMTRDALGEIDTTSFIWNKVRERSDGTLTAFGEHSFRSSGTIRTIYVTYTLQRVGNSYYITEVGSSEYRLD